MGRVDDLRLSKDGVIVDAKIERGVKIPKDTKVVVENRSAVGEQYLDFQPRSDGGPVLADGDTIAAQGHGLPAAGRHAPARPRPDRQLGRQARTCATVVDELGKGFADGGEDLQRLIDSGDALTRSATEALPETIKLIDDGRIVLDTQRDTAGDVKVFAKNFADLSETLKASDGDLRLILDRGVVASKELETLDQGQPAATSRPCSPT